MGVPRVGCRKPAASEMELFLAIVNDWKLLAIVAMDFVLDVAWLQDPFLVPSSLSEFRQTNLMMLKH